ncbi:hypothetical protein [Halobacillus mangrovi]|uniref:Uncharacterized protein n=1 Tax=Halobacillus mangrovi TaxID=402384 RepID=A0A1W5ZY26_9BACI|nr:hypothetical protein [Halobacillus mangrovi]ARI78238.1 hypothetical protein HM131_15875 [Halobacillus mangrovi]
MSYVKEVHELIDDGLNEETAVQAFQVLTLIFDEEFSIPHLEEFRMELRQWQKHRRKNFRNIIDRFGEKYPFPIELTWRNVKFKPKRVKRCAICSNYYYDVSRNGRKLTCFNNGICEHEYEVRRKRKGPVLEPIYRRRVEEVPLDFSPAKEDARQHALLYETEITAWRNGIGKL